MTAAALGDPELTLISLEHPLGGVDDATLAGRAASAAVQVAAWLGEVAGRRNA